MPRFSALIILMALAGCAQPTRILPRGEYEARNKALPPYSATAHLALGGWCEARGMHVEAITHWEHACAMDPSLHDAWQKLGFHKYGNRWRSPEEHARIMAGWKQTPEELWLTGEQWLLYCQNSLPPHHTWPCGRYRVESTAASADIARVASLLEIVDRKFALHYGIAPVPDDRTCIVRLFRTCAEFDNFMHVHALSHPAHTISLFAPAHGILLHAETANLDAALLHEATHALLHAYSGERDVESLPPWLHEGLAEYWEHGEHQGLFVWPGRFHRAWLSQATDTSLEDVLNASWDEFYQPERHLRLRSAAALLCYFMEHGAAGCHADAFRAFVRDSLQGTAPDLTQSVAPLSSLDAEFKNFVAGYSSK